MDKGAYIYRNAKGELTLSTPYVCRFCTRRFAYTRSRVTHEARCPALTKIPNRIKEMRQTLNAVKARLRAGGISKGSASAWIELIDDALHYKPRKSSPLK